MRFAIVDGKHTAPGPRMTGFCPACGDSMIAKCGNYRLHHWAHRGERVCDPWWEHETPWHRTWKSRLPDPWQEVIQCDTLGNKHIADVHTQHGLTIEFQHSHLAPHERVAREAFYTNLMWVVDGSRLKRDAPRFLRGSRSFRQLGPGTYLDPHPTETFPANWLDSAAPVLFDFGNSVALAPTTPNSEQHPLWCLLPGRALGQAVVMMVSRQAFVRFAHTAARPIQSRELLETVEEVLAAQQRFAQRSLGPTLVQTWPRRVPRRRYARF